MFLNTTFLHLLEFPEISPQFSVRCLVESENRNYDTCINIGVNLKPSLVLNASPPTLFAECISLSYTSCRNFKKLPQYLTWFLLCKNLSKYLLLLSFVNCLPYTGLLNHEETSSLATVALFWHRHCCQRNCCYCCCWPITAVDFPHKFSYTQSYLCIQQREE